MPLIKNNFMWLVCIMLGLNCQYKDDAFVLNKKEADSGQPLNVNSITKKNLFVSIEGPDNFELSDVYFKLSTKFPSPVFDIIIDPTFIIPIPVNLPLHPSIQSNVSFSDRLVLVNGAKYSYYLPDGIYFASIENGRQSRGFRLGPMELKKILFMFGYSYTNDNKGKYSKRKINDIDQCYALDVSEQYGKFEYSCPTIIREQNRTIEIKIKIGMRELNSFLTIFIKFVPGILWMGPISDTSHYFHRNYEIEVNTKDVSNNE